MATRTLSDAISEGRKTTQPVPQPTTEVPRTTQQSQFNGTAPELDWATFEQRLLNPYLQQGWIPGDDNRGQWAQQLGLDVGGKPYLQVGDLDWAGFNLGKPTGNLDDVGMPAYMANPNAAADRAAAYKAALDNPDTIYKLGTDRIGAGGTNAGGGRTRTEVQYKRVGNKLVPVSQRDFNKGSLTEDALKGGLLLAGTVAGLSALGAAGAGAGAGAGAAGAGAAGSAATNAALIESAIGTAGYGASSAGAGAAAAGAGAAGAGAAAAGGGGGAVGGGGLTLGGAGGAVGGGGLTAAPGAGLTLAAPTGSGAGLAASAGPGLTLAAPTGTGMGLSAAGASAAGASSLPSWLTSAGNKVAGQLGGKVLGGLIGGAAAGAAAGSDKVSNAGLQGVANTLGTIGNEQLDIARALYKDAQGRITVNDGLFTQIIQNALSQQGKQAQRSDQLWDAYMTDFMPNAQKFARTALDYDTAGRRDAAGAAARAAVETESAMQRQAQQRALGRAGVSIDSGRALTLDNMSRLNQTKLSTGADLDARRKVEETGLNLNLAAANLGQGIAGTSQQAAGQSLTAGNAATGTLATKESTRNATLAPTQAFYGGATSATGSAGNVLNGVANIDARNQESKNAGWAGLGQLAGTVLTAGKDSIIGGALDWLSDPKSKTVHGKVSGKKALADIEDTPVKEWTYKPGMGDEGTHVGRMAGEGDPMGRDGMRRIDPISEVGKLTAAVQQLSTDVKQIQRRLSLADAA